MAERVSSRTFVGRRAELLRLEETWKRVIADDRSAAVLMGGEAGVGKSRLVTELAQRLPDPKFVVIGHCIELVDHALPFSPIIDVLRSLQRTLDEVTWNRVVAPARDELGVLLPDLHGHPGSGLLTGALFEQIRGVFERLAEHVPTMIVIEDLHWADTSTRELVVYLAHALHAAPLLIVGTYRSDDLHRRHPLRAVLAELDRSGSVERFELARFDRDEIRELVAGIVGHEPAPDLVDRTFTRSDGNAFFAEELLASRTTIRDSMSSTLRDILLARVDALSESAQHVLRCAAVIGRTADHRLLAATAELPEVGLRAAIRESVAQQLLVSDADEFEYRFRHALVQEAVEDDLLPGDRVALHTRVAELLTANPDWLNGGGAQISAELACHWNAARNATRALEAALDAAREAEAMYAYSEALAHIERVLSLWTEVADAEVRTDMRHVEVMRYAAFLAEMSGSIDRALDYVRSALPEVDADDSVTAGLLHERWGRYAWQLSRPWEEVIEHCDEAVRLVPAQPTVERAKVLATLGQQLMLAGHRDLAIRTCEEAIDIAQQIGDRVIEGHARNSLGTALTDIGRSEDGLAQLHRAREIALESSSWSDVARAAGNESGALHMMARHEEAVVLSLQGAELARSHGLDRSCGAFLRLNANESLWELGRWDEYEEQLREIEGADPVTFDLWRAVWQRGMIEIAYGHLDAARRDVALLIEIDAASRALPSALSWLRAAIAMSEGEFARALEFALELSDQTPEEIVPCNTSGASLVLVGVEAGATLAQHQRARGDDSLETLAKMHQIGRAFDALMAENRWQRARPGDFDAMRAQIDAELARAGGADSGEQWASLASMWAQFAMRPREAYAWRRAAEAAVRNGDRDAASIAARNAYALAESIGWCVLRDAIADLARRGRLDVDVPEDIAPSPAERYGLTNRELDVVALVVEGRTNRQIAEALFISTKTASVHVSNILAKLGVHNRGEAAAAARRLGLDLAGIDP